MANNTKVRARQTAIDIAMQQHGTAEDIFKVAALNGISITADLLPGAQANYGNVSVVEVAEYFRKYGPNGIYPASAITSTIRPGGIDYMGIETDFRVS